MLKETITYTDYNGVERTEDHYFNLSKAELTEMQLSAHGGYGEMLQKIVDSKDVPAIIKIFKELILKSYGKKSDDGRRFIKSPELSLEFSQTEAFVELYMKLASDPDAAAKFANGVIPKDIAKQLPNKN